MFISYGVFISCKQIFNLKYYYVQLFFNTYFVLFVAEKSLEVAFSVLDPSIKESQKIHMLIAMENEICRRAREDRYDFIIRRNVFNEESNEDTQTVVRCCNLCCRFRYFRQVLKAVLFQKALENLEYCETARYCLNRLVHPDGRRTFQKVSDSYKVTMLVRQLAY